MSRTTNHLVLVSALALALAPGAAHARFGKSDDNDRNDNTSSSNGHNDSGNSGGSNDSASSSSGGHYHAASPVGTDRPDHGHGHHRGGCASDGCCWRNGGAWPAYFAEPGYRYVGPSTPQETQSSPDYGLRIRTELTADAMPFASFDGISAAAQLRIEGVKWGLALEGRHIAVGADDGSGETDNLSFFNGFVTYALLGNEHGRFRLEAGGNTAFAPDLIVMSPAVGASMAIGFGTSGLGLEALARASLLPHVQLELSAGLSYSLGPLGMRAGVRQLSLNDNGLVDGVAHSDTFTGPYVGIGMAF